MNGRQSIKLGQAKFVNRYLLSRDSELNVSAHIIIKCTHIVFNWLAECRSKDRSPVKELEMCDSL